MDFVMERAIKDRMKKLGIDTLDLSLMIGVGKPTVVSWLNGHKDPSLNKLMELFAVLGLKFDISEIEGAEK